MAAYVQVSNHQAPKYYRILFFRGMGPLTEVGHILRLRDVDAIFDEGSSKDRPV